MDILELKVKFFKEPYLLQRNGDWFDLQSQVHVKYPAGVLVYIPLGVGMELPEGYEAHILPRSSTIMKYGLIHVASGIIDNAYCGDNDQWNFVGYSINSGEVNIGDRICQFRLVKNMPQILFKAVPTLDNPDRGGFGSSGR